MTNNHVLWPYHQFQVCSEMAVYIGFKDAAIMACHSRPKLVKNSEKYTICNWVFGTDNQLVTVFIRLFRIDTRVSRIDSWVFGICNRLVRIDILLFRIDTQVLRIDKWVFRIAMVCLEFAVAIEGLELTIKDFRIEKLCEGYY